MALIVCMFKRINISIDAALRRAALELCKTSGLTFSGLIAKALEAFIAGHGPSPSEEVAYLREQLRVKDEQIAVLLGLLEKMDGRKKTDS